MVFIWYKRRQLMNAILTNDLAGATHLLEGGLDPNFGRNKISLSISRTHGEMKKMPPLLVISIRLILSDPFTQSRTFLTTLSKWRDGFM